MEISVIGTGYVGIVSGVCLAEVGHRVICVDVDQEKVERINAGVPPLHEIGLGSLLQKHVGRNLVATTDIRQAVFESELTLICVGTPSREAGIDLSYVETSARQIGSVLKGKRDYHVVAVKSTVVPGTTEQVVLPLLEKASGKQAGVDFGVGMNPEFLTEGQAIQDFMTPDRIVIGGIDARSMDALARAYEGFDGVPILRVNLKTAEMIKYASNAMLATQISFANEIGNLCAALGGVDVVEVMEGVHLSHYLRPFVNGSSQRVLAPISAFLEAGCGFGGSCLPKDVKALIAHGRDAEVSMALLESVLEINYKQPARLLRLLEKHFPQLEGVRVTVLGLAFKPDTDDMRESPAIPIVEELLSRGAVVRAYDPVAGDTARAALKGSDVDFASTLESAILEADAIVLVTRWEEFNRVPDLVSGMKRQPLVVDGRRVLDRTRFERYEGIGLGYDAPGAGEPTERRSGR